MSTDQIRARLERKLAAMRTDMLESERYYTGTQVLGFIDPEQLAVLGDRVQALNVNLCRLAVSAVAEKLIVSGFRSAPGQVVDDELTALWQANNLDESSALAMTDALIFGRSFFLAWADADGRPVVTAESPLQVAVERDPVTGRVVAALKRWQDTEGYTRHLLLTADTVSEFASRTSSSTDPLALSVSGSRSYAPESMVPVREDPNPLGVVPVVPLVNRPRLGHPDGESDLADLRKLVQAASKVLSDMLVASDFAAAPRRWATGLAPADVYGAGLSVEQRRELTDGIRDNWEKARASRFVAGTHEATKFGTFDQAELTNFETAVKLLVGQIASLAALPTWWVDNNAVNPISADAIRAGESRLTQRIRQRQRWFSGAFEDLMRLAVTIRDGRPDARLDDLETVWLDPEPATVAQTADAQSKLVGAGIVDQRAALEALGFSPQAIARIITETTNGATTL